MKKIILLSVLLLVSVSLFSQTPFKGFFKRFDDTLLKVDTDTGLAGIKAPAPSVWLFRPVFTISAMRFDIRDPVEVASFNSLGTGISYQRFTLDNDKPYMSFGANLIMLFTEDVGGIEPVKLSFAGTITLWQYMSFGAGYPVSGKNMFLLTGVSFSFN